MRSCQLEMSLETVLLLFYTLSNKILHQALLGFTSVCKFRIQSLFSNNAGQCIILPPQRYRQKSNSNTIFTLYKIAFVAGIRAGADPGFFFRRGCTRPLLYFNTNKPHSFFFCRIPVVLENRRSSQGEGGAHPLHPPPRSAPDGIWLLFTHKNADFGAISVTGRSCCAPVSKAESHNRIGVHTILDRFSCRQDKLSGRV